MTVHNEDESTKSLDLRVIDLEEQDRTGVVSSCGGGGCGGGGCGGGGCGCAFDE